MLKENWYQEHAYGKPIIRYPNTVYSEKEVQKMWNKTSTDDADMPRFILRPDRGHLHPESRVSGIYYCAFHKDKIVGYCGWKDRGEFIKTTGSRTHTDFKRLGINKRLDAKRTRIIEGAKKPTVVILDTRSFNNDDWINTFRGRGWTSLERAKDKLRDVTGDDDIYLRFRDRPTAHVYFPSAMKKAWRIIRPYENDGLLSKMEEA